MVNRTFIITMTDVHDIARIYNGKVLPKRTKKQNRSLHLGCSILANKLNEAGLDQRVILSKIKSEVPHTMESVKSIIQTIAEIMYGTRHTSDLDTKQISKVWDVLMYNITTQHSDELYVEFPNDEKEIWEK